MKWQTIVVFLVVLVTLLALSFLPLPIEMDRQTQHVASIVLAGVAAGIAAYAREKKDRQLRQQFANYRCPSCRYFVSHDTSKCPKCGESIIPVADE